MVHADPIVDDALPRVVVAAERWMWYEESEEKSKMEDGATNLLIDVRLSSYYF